MQRGLSRQVQFLSNVLLICWALLGFAGCGGEQLANSVVCGNGVIQGDEECDDGPANSETAACTPNCKKAYCGDGLLQLGPELCDNGPQNSDEIPNACRSNCLPASCGDTVIDTGEQCDNGPENSRSIKDACRATCQKASCGDEVIDSGEVCDQGSNNSNSIPDRCRETCQPASCGDKVIDTEEQCDNGSENSSSIADACRSNCQRANCGDGVLDSDEDCDEGLNNSDTVNSLCRTNCTKPLCAPAEVPNSIGHEEKGSLTGVNDTQVQVTCQNGYQGGGTWTCSNGTFTGQDCQAKACTPNQVKNSVAHEETGSITGNTDDKVIVICQPAYGPGGSWFCGSNGVFTGPPCSAGGCKSTQTLNSSHQQEESINGTVGSDVTVICNNGYAGGGPWKCTANDSGDKPEFTGNPCEAKACTSTSTPHTRNHSENLSIKGNTLDKVDVQCAKGYSGGGEWECQTNGDFKGLPCVPMDCNDTSTPHSDHSANGSITGKVGKKVTVDCDDGYGEDVVWTCNDTLEFTGAPCEAGGCTKTSVPNSSHSGDKSIFGSTEVDVEVKCDPGYTGGGTTTCQSDGNFMPQLSCTPNSCSSVKAPAHGALGDCSGQLESGDHCTPRCNAGYFLEGVTSCNAGKVSYAQCKPCVGNVYSEAGWTECKPHTECPRGEGVKSGGRGTATSNTQCEECTPGVNWNNSKDFTNECVPVNKCSAGTGTSSEKDKGTKTTNSNCEACTGNLWSPGASLQACKPMDTCDKGLGMTEMNPWHDIKCSPCDGESYFSDVNDRSACKPFAKECGAGKGVKTARSPQRDATCEECQDGTWSGSSSGTDRCRNIGTCDKGYGLDSPSTAYKDIGCKTCDPGTTYSNKNDSTSRCQPITKCPKGKGLRTEPTDKEDTECEHCNNSNYSDSLSATEECQPWITCTDGNTRKGASSESKGICDENACVPKSVANSNKDDDKLGGVTGEKVPVKCNDGYEGGGDWECKANSNFEGTACTAKSCEQKSVANSSSPPLNGETTQTHKIVCNNGYQGGGTWTCGTNGKFDGAECAICPIGTASSGGVACKSCNEGSTYADSPGQHTCTQSRTCPGGEEVSAASTRKANTQCKACNPGYYRGADYSGGCEPCADNHYASGSGNDSCTPHILCGKGHGVSVSPSASTNTGCTPCAKGTNYSDQNNATSACQKIKTCSKGKGVKTEATAKKDTECEPCNNNNYSDVESPTQQCEPWVSCEQGKSRAGESDDSGGSCDADTCPDLAVANSDRENSKLSGKTGIKVPVKCNDGYEGGGNWECTAANVKFEGTPCTAKNCIEKLVDNSTAAINGETTEIRDVVCKDGYEGGGTWKCGTNQQFSPDGDGTNCTICPKGKASSGGVDCQLCTQDSTYADSPGQSSCKSVTTCYPGHRVSEQPTTSRNRSCSSCPANHFSAQNNQVNCTPWKNCPVGDGAKNPPSTSTNTDCRACELGKTWNDATDKSPCQAQPPCPPYIEVLTDHSRSTEGWCAPPPDGSVFLITDWWADEPYEATELNPKWEGNPSFHKENDSWEGRLAIYNEDFDEWGAMCYQNEGLAERVAMVVCRQLGMDPLESEGFDVKHLAPFGNGPNSPLANPGLFGWPLNPNSEGDIGPFWEFVEEQSLDFISMRGLHCDGDEEHLSHCNFNNVETDFDGNGEGYLCFHNGEWNGQLGVHCEN